MPVQNAHALTDVLDFLKKAQAGDARRVTVEYILFEGVNDSPRHRRELARICPGAQGLGEPHTLPSHSGLVAAGKLDES